MSNILPVHLLKVDFDLLSTTNKLLFCKLWAICFWAEFMACIGMSGDEEKVVRCIDIFLKTFDNDGDDSIMTTPTLLDHVIESVIIGHRHDLLAAILYSHRMLHLQQLQLQQHQ